MSLIRRTHHSRLTTTDAQYPEAIRFYRDLLGFNVVQEWVTDMPGYPMQCALLDPGDNTYIELMCHPEPKPATIGSIEHMCYEVEDVRAVMAMLEKEGYPPRNAEGELGVRTFENPITLKADEPTLVWRVGFVQGPCGEMVEFLEDLGRVDK